ncbi:MAG: glycosyltransferase family 2 protein [Candidatus Omnitrophica bacterium]|nr:glycosyltransferase family 2 protein [Candidatus Omnitrophota bacterium]
MQKKRILVMIPAYNEGRVIKRLVQDISKRYPNYTILVINDGSRDDTAQKASQGGAHVVTLPYNLGIGGAVQTGFKYAHQKGYDIAIQIDGDAQHDPAYLKDVLSPVLNDEADLCIGSRFLSDRSRFKSTFLRRMGIRFFSVLLGWLTRVYLTDPTSGFRATGKHLIEHFSRYYPIDFPEPEAIKIATRYGARIREVPVNMRKRLGGTSSIRYFSTIYYMIKVTFAILIDTLKRKQ